MVLHYLVDYWALWAGVLLLAAVLAAMLYRGAAGQGTHSEAALLRFYLVFSLAYVAIGLGQVAHQRHIDPLAWGLGGLGALLMLSSIFLLARIFFGRGTSRQPGP